VADGSKFFEAAQALAQSLSQWDLLIIAGSMVVIVSTSYYRPARRKIRAAYLLFLPAASIDEAIQVQAPMSHISWPLAGTVRKNSIKSRRL
jgi:hypothetical protein